jgi:hypothetical protein
LLVLLGDHWVHEDVICADAPRQVDDARRKVDSPCEVRLRVLRRQLDRANTEIDLRSAEAKELALPSYAVMRSSGSLLLIGH